MNKKLLIGIIVVIVIAAAIGGYFYFFVKKVPLEKSPLPGKEVQKIKVTGAWALYPMMVKWVEQFQILHPEISIDLTSGGAGKGMMDILTEEVDIGMVSRELSSSEESSGAKGFSVVKGAVVPTINVKNPVLRDILLQGLSKEDFINLWIKGTITDWGELVGKSEVKAKIQLYTRLDPCGAGETWAKYLGKQQTDLRGISIYSDPGVAKAVQEDYLGAGYNNLNYAYNSAGEPFSGLVIIPLDLNGNGRIDKEENFYTTKAELIKAITSNLYPSPPARDLYLVTKGKPKGPIKEFIKWILTEGQQYVATIGYVPLHEDKIQKALSELESD